MSLEEMDTVSNPRIVQLARLIGRTPGSVKLKLGNFQSVDTTLSREGLRNYSRLVKVIWDKYNFRLNKLIIDCQNILHEFDSKIEESGEFVIDSSGYDVEITSISRRGQSIFRFNILEQYGYRCCITGLPIENMLVASHIKPWAKSTESEKVDVRNGLCMNPFHDKAFDIGLMTVDPDEYKIVYSDEIKRQRSFVAYEDYFGRYEGIRIGLPESEPLKPDQKYMKYHYDKIFIG